MDASEYRRLSQIEDHHWWFRSIHSLIVDVFKGPTLSNSRSDLKRPLSILDAGCGTGGLTKKLGSIGNVVGLDIESNALSSTRRKALDVVQGSVNNLPFRDGSFDVMTSISVLYHSAVDDRSALGEMGRVLKPGGFAIVVVPAFRWLWGHHDAAVHTKKRYSMSDISHLIQHAGFTIAERRYLFSLFFPLFVLKRLLDRFLPERKVLSDLAELPSWLNNVIEMALWVEWKVGRIFSLPFGSSILVVARL